MTLLFFKRRSCLVPTFRAWLLIGLSVLVLSGVAVRHVHSFLSVTDPVDADLLVIEGWAPDYALEAARSEFLKHHYAKLYVTGGPLERGALLSEYRTYAELGTAGLRKMGVEAVQAVPSLKTRKDRTYLSALALKEFFQKDGKVVKKINLISMGAHSRRSRMLFEQAFGSDTKVGIIAIEDQDYDATQWWKSSQGFRSVTDELIAYVYARLFFSPARG